MSKTKKIIPLVLMAALIVFGYQRSFWADYSWPKRFIVQTVWSTFEINTPIAMSITAVSQTWGTMKSYVWDVFLEIDRLTYGRDYLVPSSGMISFTSWDQGIKVFATWLLIKKAWTYSIKVVDIIDEEIQWIRTVTITDHTNSNVSTNDDDIDSVVDWLYENGLTVFSTSATFHPERSIRRDEAAKFMVIFAENILDEQSEEDPACDTFTDIAQTNSLKEYIIQACDLGYLKWSNHKATPSNNLSNQQALAIIMRMYEWQLDEPKSDRSKNYYARAKELGISDGLNLTDKKQNITRWKFATLLYRIADIIATENWDNEIDTFWSELEEWLTTLFEGLVEMLWLKINAHSGLNNDFINKAAICESWASVTTETNFDMIWMNFSMTTYRQIRWFEGTQCKIYERIDAASVTIATGQMQSGLFSGATQAEIDEQISEVQSGIKQSIWKDGICLYNTGTLFENLQLELSGEFMPMPMGDKTNCTWALYEEE